MPFVIPSLIRNTFSSVNNQCRDASGMRQAPELLVLDVADGMTPIDKPPVRIFLGTEPAQYRAERIFIWSIEQVRDPARVYEIYIMKELAGFDRRRWLTGFTNYRFAIPWFAGGKGKAIWNDVDQAYLADPAELFDTDMGECGVLTVPPLTSSALLDTAVMLIDCERMASVWTEEGAKHGKKNQLLARVDADGGLRGDLPGEWNARDEEYVPGRSKLLHWTILHTQPWHPLPHLFVYQNNPVGHIWYEMERSANKAAYQVFTAERPSEQYAKVKLQLNNCPTTIDAPDRVAHRPSDWASLQGMINQSDVRTLLVLSVDDSNGPDDLVDQSFIRDRDIAVTRLRLLDLPVSEAFDAVVCRDTLNYIPDEDVPWVMENLFDVAKQFVYLEVDKAGSPSVLSDGSILAARGHEPDWWQGWFESAAMRHLHIQCKLVYADSKNSSLRQIDRCDSRVRKVWVLCDGHSVDTAQAVALAEALKWPYEIHQAPDAPLCEKPDLVIATNRSTGAWAKTLRKESSGYIYTIRIDSVGDASPNDFDVVVSPGYFRLPRHPHRIETITQLSRVTPNRLAQAREKLPQLLGLARRPRIVLMLGARDVRSSVTAKSARQMGEEIRTFAHLAGASVFAIIDRNTKPRVAGALVSGLGSSTHIFSRPVDRMDDDACLAYLDLADILIVAGSDESLIADATATGKPVYFYSLSLSQSSTRPAQQVREYLFACSQSRPLNKRGTVRPQQGMEYFCARLFESGFVRPPHDLNALTQSLIREGAIHIFGAPVVATNPPGLQVAGEVASEVRRRLGCSETCDLNDDGVQVDENRVSGVHA